LVTGAKS